MFTASSSRPPVATAITVDDVVATFDRPMCRPDDAFGMMSVISAQSTARKVPADAPNKAPPTIANGTAGASAARAIPTKPITQLA
jgi:hypothetical protein